MPVIRISDSLYKKLASLAKGFDTPQNVIERLVNKVEGIDMKNGGDGDRDRVEIESNYINYVNSNTEANQGNNYLSYIVTLEEHLDERILGVYSLDELEVMRRRLSSHGNLYEFNRTNNGFPSAAIGKLIDFCRTESQDEVKGIDMKNGGDRDRVEIESNYINYVNSNTEANQGNNYLNYIVTLEEHLNKRILGVYSLDELRVMRRRLLMGGDLYEFNRTNNGFPSAAIRKLIDFCRTESQETD